MSSYNQKKSFCFTLNNYSDEEYSHISSYLETVSDYYCIGKEIGSEGTPHLQGYFSLKKRNSLVYLKNNVSSRAHFEPARGTGCDNRTYCSKGGDFIEHGVCPSRKRTRDELAVEFRTGLERGRSGIVEFADKNPGVYAWSGSTLLRNFVGRSGAEPRPDISVEWVYGEPGIGKSRYAHERYPNAYIKDPRTKWWNGYLLEKEVIIDDFAPGGIDINHLLRWFDRYKCYVEVKGDMVPLCASVFIVTSNFKPCDVFKVLKYKHMSDVVYEDHPQLPALLRRIKIIHLC